MMKCFDLMAARNAYESGRNVTQVLREQMQGNRTDFA